MIMTQDQFNRLIELISETEGDFIDEEDEIEMQECKKALIQLFESQRNEQEEQK